MAVTQSFRNLICALVCALALGLALAKAALAQDVLLTLPFENVSGRSEYNWVGESFVVLYGDLLETPHMKVLDPDERNLVYEKLGLRASDILTRAAVMRVAETAQASLALVGTYDIGGEGANTSIAISARLIEVSTGRLVGNKVFTRSGLLGDLQEMQGELAWNALNERNPATDFTKEQLVATAKSYPPRAYESFVKGIQTQDAKLREMLLRRALQEAGNTPYPQALYELGLLFYRQRAYVNAVEQFRHVQSNEPRYFESQFYLGLSAHNLGNTLEAATALDHLVEPVPLTEVFNNAGALWFLQGDQTRGLGLLRRAVAQNPADLSYRFNYGYALWKAKNYSEAAQMLKVAAEQNPRDGEAWFLWAKSLEGAGNPAEATKVDDQAKRNFPNYARWAVAPDKIPVLFRLKSDFSRAQFFRLQRAREQAAKKPAASAQAITPPATTNAVVAAAAPPVTSVSANNPVSPPASTMVSNPVGNLERARQFVETSKDAEALNELQLILTAEATNSEAHYLRGLVLQRRNEPEAAINAFQSAIYWNPRFIAGHLALGRMFLARNDRALALTHARQALQIDPQNRDAVALKQQIETGR